MQTRKDFLFNNEKPWFQKAGEENFDVAMGCYILAATPKGCTYFKNLTGGDVYFEQINKRYKQRKHCLIS